MRWVVLLLLLITCTPQGTLVTSYDTKENAISYWNEGYWVGYGYIKMLDSTKFNLLFFETGFNNKGLPFDDWCICETSLKEYIDRGKVIKGRYKKKYNTCIELEFRGLNWKR